ncbi:MAG: outer membrane beta-barrel protein [Armatimonadetes bacterium]|nr:outer membrane beta-barrel protein [Armatimonadota bacterium]
MRRCLAPVCALAALAAPAASFAQTFVGPEVGLFYPSSGTLRDAIGSSWFSFGLGRLNLNDYGRTKVTPNFNIITGDSGGSKVAIVSYTLGVVQSLKGTGLSKSSMTPYFAYRGGLSYTDYAVNANGGRISGKRLGYDVNAEIGVLFNNNLSLAARYDLVSEHDGLNFNGLSLSLKYGIAKF